MDDNETDSTDSVTVHMIVTQLITSIFLWY